MAWRLADVVESGELDNRTRGRVTGWIRLFGRASPLSLDLTGDCHPDLAGWRFRIVRLEAVPKWAKPLDLAGFSADQVGEVGDISAEQLVRHHECSDDDLLRLMHAGELPPRKLRPALYLEWCSEQNGRVVIHDTRLGVDRVGEQAFTLAMVGTTPDSANKSGIDG